jgi:hypothetical protein
MTNEEKSWGHFMQSNSMAHIAKNSMDALDAFSGLHDHVI